MIPTNMWEHQNAIKTLYAKCVGDVCGKHGITRIELDVLLFLANNRQFDTATDIVEVRYLSKSQVSAAVSRMEDCGYLRKEYAQANRKNRAVMPRRRLSRTDRLRRSGFSTSCCRA